MPYTGQAIISRHQPSVRFSPSFIDTAVRHPFWPFFHHDLNHIINRMLDESRHDQCEETPLLGHDHAPESGHSTRARWVLIVLSLGIIAVNFGSYLAMAPQIQIFEYIICQKMHPEIALLTPQEQIDARCKSPDVQGELALVNGWKETLDALPGIFLALPFGLMADQAGRKKVLMLSLIGLIIEEVVVRIIGK